ncbi:hypothetical protein, partial [Bordetella holmesii]
AGSSERRSFTPGLYVGAVLNLGAGQISSKSPHEGLTRCAPANSLAGRDKRSSGTASVMKIPRI